MAVFISVLLLLLAVSIISIDYLRGKIKELEASSRELNEDYGSTANIAGDLEQENTQLKAELKCANHFIGPAIEKKEGHIVVFNTMSKNPETNQEAFERYYQARKMTGIHSNLTKGKDNV